MIEIVSQLDTEVVRLHYLLIYLTDNIYFNNVVLFVPHSFEIESAMSQFIDNI